MSVINKIINGHSDLKDDLALNVHKHWIYNLAWDFMITQMFETFREYLILFGKERHVNHGTIMIKP